MPRLESDEEDALDTATRSPANSIAKIPSETPRTTDFDNTNQPVQGEIGRPFPDVNDDGVFPSNRAISANSVSRPDSPSSRLGQALSADRQTSADETLALEVANLTTQLQAVSSQAAGKVLQKFWRKFLFSENDDDHLCWLLRAGVKNAPTPVIERLLKDQTILNVLTPTIIKKESIVTSALRYAGHDQLLKYVPGSVLDREIQKRLRTMPAKLLIRWLAQAERLGFREDDILDEDEAVMPNPAIFNSSTPGSASAAPYAPNAFESGSVDVEMLDRPPLPSYQPPVRNNVAAPQNYNVSTPSVHPPAAVAPPNNSSNTRLECPICRFIFTHVSGYNYHLAKKVCTLPKPLKGYRFFCDNCGRGFTTKQGMHYHVHLHKVCFSDGITLATTPTGNLQQPQQIPHHQIAEGQNSSQRRPADHILPPSNLTYHQPQDQAWAPQPPSTSQYNGQTPLQTSRVQIPVSNGAYHGDSSFAEEQTPSSERRMLPSELPPEKYAQLNQALAAQEKKYQAQCAAVDPGLNPQQRSARLQSLKNAHATKKSQIRKKFNVTLNSRYNTVPVQSTADSNHAKSRLQEYRASSNLTGDVARVSGSSSARSSPIMGPALSFDRINAPAGVESRLPQQPVEQSSSGLSQVAETQMPTHKRPRTEGRTSENLSSHTTSTAAVELINAKMNERQTLQMRESVTTGPNMSGHLATGKGSIHSSDTVSSRTEAVAERQPIGMKMPEYIDLASTSDDSSVGGDRERIPARPAPVSRGGHAASGMSSSPPNVGKSGPPEDITGDAAVRRPFTAKRGGKH